MNISDISAAQRLKFQMKNNDASGLFRQGDFLRIRETGQVRQFTVVPFGGDRTDTEEIFMSVSQPTGIYLADLLSAEKQGIFRTLFAVEDVEAGQIGVQAYVFECMTEYASPIVFLIPEKLEKYSVDRLRSEFVWSGLGQPGVFCLNYQNSKKNQMNIRILGRNKYLQAVKTERGIVVTSEKPEYIKKDSANNLTVNLYQATSVEFVTDTGSNIVQDKTYLQNISAMRAADSYLGRWDAYKKLTKEVLEEEAGEFGNISYSQVDKREELNDTTYVFHVKEMIDQSYKGSALSAAASFGEGSRVRPLEVGMIKSIERGRITTVLPASDKLMEVPESGQLRLSTRGDEAIAKRRDAAEERIMRHDAPIRYLASLIEFGVTEYSPEWYKNKAVTDKLERNFKRSREMNDQQRQALDMAINTPDIVLIQGPPGTGKTTVIKAIQERFRELYEDEERAKQRMDPDYVIQSPRILISSFQNEAVNNAVANPRAGEMPAGRRSGRKDIREQSDKVLKEWYESLKGSLEKSSVDPLVSAFYEKQMQFRDAYFAYRKSGEKTEDAVQLIRDHVQFGRDCYPQSLIKTANQIIDAFEQAKILSEVDVSDPLSERLKQQRITAEAYEDDGRLSLGRLLAYLGTNQDDRVSEEQQEVLREMFLADDVNSPEFEKYVALVRKLQESYCTEEKRIDIRNSGNINAFLTELQNAFDDSFAKTTSSFDAQKAEIIQEFIHRLEDEYETVVRKYSTTTAATCQASLDLRAGTNEVFDLVIIDEAARANPLDLLIPMSMGKKIVLVGDQKQLPHMLEPDVVKKIQQDPEFREMPELEKSLFQHMYDMLVKIKKPKAMKLVRQYRMHPAICRFVSHQFYQDDLVSGISEDARSSPVTINEGKALTFINVPKTAGAETFGSAGSKKRDAEVEIVKDQLLMILKNMPPEMYNSDDPTERKVGIITFYSAQATALKEKIGLALDDEQKDHVEIGTVDAFQGKEYAYVILSCVRSNDETEEEKSVGFLVKPNRLCVAFSRAKRQLIACGDSETLSRVSYFRDLVQLCKTDKEARYIEC